MRRQFSFFNLLVAMLVALSLAALAGLVIGPAYASTGGAIVPEINPLEKLGELITNWSAMSDLSKGVLFVAIVVQVLKQAVDFQYKRLAVVVLSLLYGVGQLVLGGESALAATVSVLISGGGAMLLYEALKPILKKFAIFSKLKLGN